MNKENRIWYLDYLRILAILMVMVIHMPGYGSSKYALGSYAWYVFNISHGLARWCIPVFVMISGALFLNRDIPIKTIYKKYILRLATAFIFWSIIYMIPEKGSIIDRIILVIKGHYHMWFIPMIIALYMIIPLLKPIIKNEKNIKYFLIIAFIFSTLIPFLLNIASDFLGGNSKSIVSAIRDLVGNVNLKFVDGFTRYFILGYYLSKIDIPKKKRMIIYILGIIAFIMTIALGIIVSLKTNGTITRYSYPASVTIYLSAIAIFTWFKYRKFDKDKINKIILKISKYSFGAYLSHILVRDYIVKLIDVNLVINKPILLFTGILLSTAVISFIISAIINHIPILKKYIV